MGCEFATLTQPIPATWVWQVFWCFLVSVVESHTATQYPWHGFLLPSPSLPIAHLTPNCSQLPHPYPPQRDVGWLVLTWSGGIAGRTQGGTQQVGGPVGVSQEWATTYGPFALIPLSWTPTNAPSTSHHVGCIDLTTHTSLQTWWEPAHPTPLKTWWPPQCQTPPLQTQPSDYN